jgi:hypothetical protein
LLAEPPESLPEDAPLFSFLPTVDPVGKWKAWVILLLLFVLASRGTTSVAASGPAAAPALEQRLESIRAAFLADDAARLGRQFRTDRPVYVSVTEFERGRFLGPGPLQALLDRIVAETEPVGFEFSPAAPSRPAALSRMSAGLESADRRSVRLQHTYQKARWTYIETASNQRRVVDLYLALQRQPEDGEWRIVEIKGFS